MSSEQTPSPKAKRYRIIVTWVDNSWMVYPHAYIVQKPCTAHWAVCIVHPDGITLYPYAQIKSIDMEEEKDNEI